MGPILNDKFKWFLVLIILALLLLWYLSDILAPFIIGAIIAYLLDPLADKLQSFGISRLFTALMISVVSVSILIILVILILYLDSQCSRGVRIYEFQPGFFHTQFFGALLCVSIPYLLV